MAALAVGVWLWRLPPTIPAGAEPIFEGVYYLRDVRTSPRLMVTHLVFIDLRAPGVGFLVTPGQPVGGRQMPARTASQCLSEFHVQLAINGDGFAPFSEEGSSYYPHAGDPVDVTGFASSQGRVYSTGDSSEPTLYLSRGGGASFQPPLIGWCI